MGKTERLVGELLDAGRGDAPPEGAKEAAWEAIQAAKHHCSSTRIRAARRFDLAAYPSKGKR